MRISMGDEYAEISRQYQRRVRQLRTGLPVGMGEHGVVAIPRAYRMNQDGSVLDVGRLNSECVDNPVRYFRVSELIGRVSRSPREGFSRRRLERADPDKPILLDALGHVLDGRHRLVRAHLEKRGTVPGRIATCAQMAQCVVDRPASAPGDARSLRHRGGDAVVACAGTTPYTNRFRRHLIAAFRDHDAAIDLAEALTRAGVQVVQVRQAPSGQWGVRAHWSGDRPPRVNLYTWVASLGGRVINYVDSAVANAMSSEGEYKEMVIAPLLLVPALSAICGVHGVQAAVSRRAFVGVSAQAIASMRGAQLLSTTAVEVRGPRTSVKTAMRQFNKVKHVYKQMIGYRDANEERAKHCWEMLKTVPPGWHTNYDSCARGHERNVVDLNRDIVSLLANPTGDISMRWWQDGVIFRDQPVKKKDSTKREEGRHGRPRFEMSHGVAMGGGAHSEDASRRYVGRGWQMFVKWLNGAKPRGIPAVVVDHDRYDRAQVEVLAPASSHAGTFDRGRFWLQVDNVARRTGMTEGALYDTHAPRKILKTLKFQFYREDDAKDFARYADHFETGGNVRVSVDGVTATADFFDDDWNEKEYRTHRPGHEPWGWLIYAAARFNGFLLGKGPPKHNYRTGTPGIEHPVRDEWESFSVRVSFPRRAKVAVSPTKFFSRLFSQFGQHTFGRRHNESSSGQSKKFYDDDSKQYYVAFTSVGTFKKGAVDTAQLAAAADALLAERFGARSPSVPKAFVRKLPGPGVMSFAHGDSDLSGWLLPDGQHVPLSGYRSFHEDVIKRLRGQVTGNPVFDAVAAGYVRLRYVAGDLYAECSADKEDFVRRWFQREVKGAHTRLHLTVHGEGQRVVERDMSHGDVACTGWPGPSSLSEEAVRSKRDIARVVADELRITQGRAHPVVNATLDAIADTLVKEGRLELRGFGVFEIKHRQARRYRDPNRGGSPVIVPDRVVVVFRPSKILHERVNAPMGLAMGESGNSLV